MSRKGAIEVEGVVMEVLPNRTCQVKLPNGHRVLAYMTGKARLSFTRLAAGDKVVLELSPYDLSEGRIVMEQRKS
jgi:translation initiation factor IF-1